MRNIISVSRRTDIPAFYGEWFKNRIKEGFACYVNPFGGQKHIVSLKPEDVLCFVFWSKNFEPFHSYLAELKNLNYNFYFNYTITGLPNIFECNLVGKEVAIKSLKYLSDTYSPKHINWRYDPIILSDITDFEFHLKNFSSLCKEIHHFVERCYFSFVVRYGKVQRNFEKFSLEKKVNFIDPSKDDTIQLANKLAEIAENYGIKMFSCCGDYLINDKIGKAHCIDIEIIQELFFVKEKIAEKPTRKECGCTESIDIGTYDTCPHGCIYCYANVNKIVASRRYKEHEPQSAFLGYSFAESDKWIKEIQETKKYDISNHQLTLFN